MRAFIKTVLLLLLAGSLGAQEANDPASISKREDSLRAVYVADSVSAARIGELKRLEQLRDERETFWVRTFVLSGAAIFCIWAALYKKRYREQFTINGRYIGIGSQYYHDHFETDHFHHDGAYSRYGRSVRPQDDPWCYREYENRQARLREWARREKEFRKGGGASGTW
ncbi:MAG: hypothetical protein EOO16_12865 [Chitinophagaceae bacterium]|nr:MAG: hypothetical protein EOO16_12865 [Chitinophagaceae bacterium]